MQPVWRETQVSNKYAQQLESTVVIGGHLLPEAVLDVIRDSSTTCTMLTNTLESTDLFEVLRNQSVSDVIFVGNVKELQSFFIGAATCETELSSVRFVTLLVPPSPHRFQDSVVNARENAAVRGFFKSLRHEYSEKLWRIECVEIMEVTLSSVSALESYLTTPVTTSGAHFIINASGALLHEKLVKMAVVEGAEEKSTIADASSVLVTGGTGALGLQLASWLVKEGAKRVILLSRSGAISERYSGLWDELSKSIGMANNVVEIARCDCCDKNELRGALRLYKPTVVFHCAGVLSDGLVRNQTPARFRAVMAPKAMAAVLLDHLCSELRIDLSLMVLFSSVTSLTGNAGQTSYGAANSVLDSLAESRNRRGARTLSIQWGPWADHGMAAGIDMTNSLWLPHAADRAVELLLSALHSNAPVVTIAKVNTRRSGTLRAVDDMFEEILTQKLYRNVAVSFPSHVGLRRHLASISNDNSITSHLNNNTCRLQAYLFLTAIASRLRSRSCSIALSAQIAPALNARRRPLNYA